MPAIVPSIRALVPLASLLRAAMSRHIGVRLARVLGIVVVLGLALAMWLLAGRYGPDATTLLLLSRSALVVVASCGALAGLSLSRSARDADDFGGIVALASSRGFSVAEIELCETVAALRITAETVLGPIVAIGVVALAIATGRHLPGTWRVIAGTAAFGAVASVGIGLLAAACRRWAGARGRSWFVLVVAVPWVLAEIAPSAWGSEYLSIPGLIGRAWSLLALGDM